MSEIDFVSLKEGMRFCIENSDLCTSCPLWNKDNNYCIFARDSDKDILKIIINEHDALVAEVERLRGFVSIIAKQPKTCLCGVKQEDTKDNIPSNSCLMCMSESVLKVKDGGKT
jgi:hypothetical protein